MGPHSVRQQRAAVGSEIREKDCDYFTVSAHVLFFNIPDRHQFVSDK